MSLVCVASTHRLFAMTFSWRRKAICPPTTKRKRNPNWLRSNFRCCVSHFEPFRCCSLLFFSSFSFASILAIALLSITFYFHNALQLFFACWGEEIYLYSCCSLLVLLVLLVSFTFAMNQSQILEASQTTFFEKHPFRCKWISRLLPHSLLALLSPLLSLPVSLIECLLIFLFIPLFSLIIMLLLIQNRDRVMQMFHHAFQNYVTFAFPHDEVCLCVLALWFRLSLLSLLFSLFSFSCSTCSFSSLCFSLPLSSLHVSFHCLPLCQLWFSFFCFSFQLKPLSGTWTDSLIELGNAIRGKSDYHGVALTLVDSLDTLAIVEDRESFTWGVKWLASNLSFDLDARVNVFESNIRLLGGLISAHFFAIDSSLGLILPPYKYDGALLRLATDLGNRLLRAFDPPSTSSSPPHSSSPSSFSLPYAWVNLRHGVSPGETKETCTANLGTMLLEFGMLSYLTENAVYYEKAYLALRKLWSLQSPIGLFGNTLDIGSSTWTNEIAGIGAGIGLHLCLILLLSGLCFVFLPLVCVAFRSSMHRRSDFLVVCHFAS